VAAIQWAADDDVHVGPKLETVGEAFQLMAKQAKAKATGRATDAAMPGRGGRAERRRERLGDAGRIPGAARD
jgi:hypothetical protein